MKIFRIKLMEYHMATVMVEAENEQDAIDRVKTGDGDYIDLEFSDVEGTENWIVEEA